MNSYRIREALRTRSIFDVDLRVAYYARVSTDKEEQKNSIKHQKSHFEELISSNPHWVLVGAYIDDGISGIHAEKREEFQRMFRDAKEGKFDLLITKEISRFARNTLDSIQYTRELLRHGVCVWFQNDNINTADEDSEFRLTIMAGVAQDEIRKLSSRVRFGHAQSIKNGVVLGNSHIYGYNKEKGRLTVNEEEAPMVRLIFEQYAGGSSTPQIEELLYAKGYRNYKGGKISRGVIQHIITNPKYKGWYAGGKVKVTDMFTKKQEFLPEDEWTMFKDDGSHVPAIVGEDIWETANRRFRERSEAIKSHRTSYKQDNLFTGKLFCADDGAPYWMKQHHIRGNEDVRWVCSHRIKNGADSCRSFGLSEMDLKVMLADIIERSAPHMDDIADMYVAVFEKISREGEVSRDAEILGLNSRIQTIKAKMEKLLDYNLNGSISDSEFLRRNTEYNTQIKDMENSIRELSKLSSERECAETQIREIVEAIKGFSGIGPDDITRQVIENLVDHILVTPLEEHHARIQFFLKSGLKNASYAYWRSNHTSGITAETAESLSETGETTGAGCSGNVLNNMFPEQHMTAYRNLRSCEGHMFTVQYTYSLAI